MAEVPIINLQPGRSMMLDPTAFVADPELVDSLTRKAIPITCETERVLFRQGDTPAGLFILNSGKVNLSMDSPTGESILSFQTTAGSLLGLPGLVSSQPYTLSAVAQAGAKISFLDREAFTTLMNANPALAFKVLQVLAAEVSAARRAIPV